MLTTPSRKLSDLHRAKRRLSLGCLVSGLLLALLGLLEHPTRAPRSNHNRELTVLAGLFLGACGGPALLSSLGRRDPLVPDEKYYNLVSSRKGSRGRPHR